MDLYLHSMCLHGVLSRDFRLSQTCFCTIQRSASIFRIKQLQRWIQKMKALQAYETSVTIYPTTQRNIASDLNLKFKQEHVTACEELAVRTKPVTSTHSAAIHGKVSRAITCCDSLIQNIPTCHKITPQGHHSSCTKVIRCPRAGVHNFRATVPTFGTTAGTPEHRYSPAKLCGKQDVQATWSADPKHGTVSPRTGHEGPEAEQTYSSTLSSTLARDGAGWLGTRPGRFTRWEETRYP